MPTDTKLNQLIINQLTQEQYDEAKAAGTLSDTELYITDSDDDALTNNKISNCITEIPQDIKLELNNGTLTLKAGSKVYVPNGFESDGTTPIFDVVTIESDVQLLSSLTSTYTDGNYSWCYNNTLKKIQGGNNKYNQIQSNTYDNSTQYCMFYDTTNNIIKYTANSGATWETGYSLCFCLSSLKSGEGLTSINQVFNGFGYIGSTIYALPGVKGLIPNGRNADGSLKNIEFTLDKVSITINGGSTDTRNIILYSNGYIDHPELSGYLYDENFFWTKRYDGTGYIKGSMMCVGPVEYSSGKVTSFTPKTVFHALDYNDKSTISGWSMPSSRYIDLTLAASGSKYTAPANGWFSLWLKDNMPSQGRIIIRNEITKFCSGIGNNNNLAGYTALNYPASKGTIVTIYYEGTSAPSSYQFRFIYAEGE